MRICTHERTNYTHPHAHTHTPECTQKHTRKHTLKHALVRTQLWTYKALGNTYLYTNKYIFTLIQIHIITHAHLQYTPSHKKRTRTYAHSLTRKHMHFNNLKTR